MRLPWTRALKWTTCSSSADSAAPRDEAGRYGPDSLDRWRGGRKVLNSVVDDAVALPAPCGTVLAQTQSFSDSTGVQPDVASAINTRVEKAVGHASLSEASGIICVVSDGDVARTETDVTAAELL
jgi:hypothetical protein